MVPGFGFVICCRAGFAGVGLWMGGWAYRVLDLDLRSRLGLGFGV